MSDVGEARQTHGISEEQRKELTALVNCMREGYLLKCASISIGMYTFFEVRKRRGFNNRHWLLNGLMAGLSGMILGRWLRFQECKEMARQRFPNGQLASLAKGKVRPEMNEPTNFGQNPNDQSDEWSGTGNDNTSDSWQNQTDTSTENTSGSEGLTMSEARQQYQARSQQNSSPWKRPKETESSFFTDINSKSKSNTGQNKYGDSWDNSD
ncbi:uncharacterized protein LOC132550858 [Ylistrum balloti]|uniref:uncharacterized protein LOC132550858 n=1 Tax=Ylistrum balloti TaxID=509963 RepID=UPI002905D874|nr:uncharacterized protein LOC132550858 [Ylistrum balloti]